MPSLETATDTAVPPHAKAEFRQHRVPNLIATRLPLPDPTTEGLVYLVSLAVVPTQSSRTETRTVVSHIHVTTTILTHMQTATPTHILPDQEPTLQSNTTSNTTFASQGDVHEGPPVVGIILGAFIAFVMLGYIFLRFVYPWWWQRRHPETPRPRTQAPTTLKELQQMEEQHGANGTKQDESHRTLQSY